jgi:hypothetical protein
MMKAYSPKFSGKDIISKEKALEAPPRKFELRLLIGELIHRVFV